MITSTGFLVLMIILLIAFGLPVAWAILQHRNRDPVVKWVDNYNHEIDKIDVLKRSIRSYDPVTHYITPLWVARTEQQQEQSEGSGNGRRTGEQAYGDRDENQFEYKEWRTLK